MNSTITTKNKRIDSLDLLKAIAIMLVLALHVPLYHIDFIEQEYGIGNIYRIHCYKYFDKLKPLDIYPISPSKANTLVSLLISISFLILFFYETGILNCVFYLYCKDKIKTCNFQAKAFFFMNYYTIYCVFRLIPLH